MLDGGLPPRAYALASRCADSCRASASGRSCTPSPTELGLAGHVTNTADGVVVEVEGAAGGSRRSARRVATEAPPLAVRRVGRDHDGPRPRRHRVHHPRLALRRRPHPGLPGHRDLRRLPRRAGRPGRPALPPPVRHLHPLRPALHDRHRRCPTTGPAPPWPASRCAPTAPASTPTRPTAASTPSRSPARPAVRGCGWSPDRSRAPDAPTAARTARSPRRARLLARGAILAVKGLGGYHLACDATNPAAVALLRTPQGARGQAVRRHGQDARTTSGASCGSSPEERSLLDGARQAGRAARRRPRRSSADPRPAEAVAPGSPDLGVMLPYTPLHHLLLGLPGDPAGPRLLVMTSGNVSGEPIVTDDDRGAGAARRAWPTPGSPTTGRSTCRATTPWSGSATGEPLPIRRSRGYAPLPLHPARCPCGRPSPSAAT